MAKKKCLLGPNSWQKDKRFFEGQVGALPKVLDAYMGEVVWPNPPEEERHGLHGHWPNVRAQLPNMVQVLIMLLRQRDDQHKIGIP